MAKLTIAASAALVWLAAAAAAAAPADLGETIAGHPGLTYFTLMKRVVTDLSPGGPDGAKGHAVVPFKHIEGADSENDPPETVVIQSVDVMPIPDDPDQIVILANLGSSEDAVAPAQVLALFALSPTPRLLDTVEVGTDHVVGFALQAAPPMLAPRSPLILISSGHDNSNQSYRSTEMIFIRDGRFSLIDSVFSFGDADCDYRRTQEPLFATFPAPGPYRALDVRVRERVTVPGDSCGSENKPPKVRETIHQATYRWDGSKKRFVTQSGDLKRLADEDAKRF